VKTKTWDVIIVGAGIIGLSLAIELRKHGMRVLIVERGEPGREASYAAAGMLAASGEEFPAPLRGLAEESARMYPEFVHELEDESGIKTDFRDQGTIVFSCEGHLPAASELLSPQRLKSLEPELKSPCADSQPGRTRIVAGYLRESSVDPRALTDAAVKAARHRDADLASGSEVRELVTEAGRVTGVRTDKTLYSAEAVVNCAGAWAGMISPHEFPVKPVKGQMLATVAGPHLKHVVRSEKVYLVPRGDGRVVIGSTLEDAGYNKRTEVSVLQSLFQAAVELAPGLAQSRRHEAWAGLRPGTPDELPILGQTSTSGFYVATGHYRDGILLAPVTAKVMAELITGQHVSRDLSPFSPSRF
jgi:glycine oxidase